MKFIKFIIVILATIVLGLGSFTPLAQAHNYKDVDYTYWAYNDINFLSSFNVITGFKGGEFKPGLTIKRKDAAVMMVRALEKTELGDQEVVVKDMLPTSPGYKEVEMALSRGWFSTFEGKFLPDGNLTRNEMARALATAFGYNGNGTSSFVDVSRDNPYYEYIDAILYHEVTEGYKDKTFRPLEQVTRAQFSAFLSRVFHQPIAYEIKVNGEVVETVQSLDTAIYLAGNYEGSSIHPASHKYMSFSQEVANADKTGIKAGVLIYNGLGENDTFTPSFFDPYLSYKTQEDKEQSMFDTFVILALRYDGGQFSETAQNKANYAEYEWILNRTFADDGALNNLNTAAKAKGQKADIYITIPYPKRTEDFIALDGSEIANDVYARYDIGKWYIDRVLNKMQSSQFDNLNLKGFYWMNETVKVTEDEVLISTLSNYIRNKGKFFIYAPHATSTNFRKWKSYGFDAAFLQPNAFRTNITNKEERLHRAFVNAQIYGAGITMEIDSYGTEAQALQGAEAFEMYMDFAKRYNLSEKGMMFYQDRNMVYRMATFNYPVYQNFYKQLTDTFFPFSIEE
ncbi:DUF4855 domain-containing protein [Psychrobacillus sp. NPDC096623]|uniref:DUF4855 domain-containing protein n=1 Tax=Psychrobacillus sp. NPDC096623 TaxID=3364492 RepID=UPI00380F5DD1